MYEIVFPDARLRPFVECYWFLKTRLRPPQQLEEVIFTDARADIVFVYNSPYVRRKPGEAAPQLVRASNVDAQRRYPVRIQQQGPIHLIGVRFRPGGLAPFVSVPVYELSGSTVSLADAFGPAGADLEGKLYDVETGPGRRNARRAQVQLLDEFFLSRLTLPPEHAQVTRWMAAIEQRRGLVSIAHLSRETGYSVRSVDRMFQRVLGLSPKFFARTVRFRHVHYELMRQPEFEWDAIVAAYGYYDQSHFAKDVWALTGVGPRQYREHLTAKRRHPPPNHVQFLQDLPAGQALE